MVMARARRSLLVIVGSPLGWHPAELRNPLPRLYAPAARVRCCQKNSPGQSQAGAKEGAAHATAAAHNSLRPFMAAFRLRNGNTPAFQWKKAPTFQPGRAPI